MNNTKDDIKKAAEVAQFRFGIIAPVIQDLYPDASRTAYYKRVADSAFMHSADSNRRFCGAKRTRCGASGLL